MPRSLWLAPLVVFLLRALPALVAFTAPEPAGQARLPVGYIPKDFLQYVAFERQALATGDWLLANPFTTEPQDGRFVAPFLAALGNLCRETGLDPFVALELSRLAVYALFFVLLWRFTAAVLPDRIMRLWACWLVALSGGFGWLGRLAVPGLPPAIADEVALNLWNITGWSTFEALYNPLWGLGLALTLVAITPAVRPEGPRGAGDLVRAGAGLFALHAVHPYSAIVVLAVVLVRIGRALTSREDETRWLAGRLAAAFAPGLIAIAALSVWQLRDPVFRAAAGGVIGTQFVSLLWYPLGLGLFGVFAWMGFRDGRRRSDPWSREIAWWAGTVAVLHNVPGLNGYHFLFHLHLPLSLLAAPTVAAVFRRSSTALRTGLVAALFLSSLAVTVEAVVEVLRSNVVPRGWIESARILSEHPAGNVLAPQPLGNLVPAYGPHRVWVGHWFLTPDARRRARRVDELLGAPARHREELRALVSGQRIRYLVVPRASAGEVATVLRVEERQTVGDLEVLTIGTPLGE